MAIPIQKATRERLKEAVHDMTILYDDGMSPANALLKVANEFRLQDDQIRFVGRAFNTAQANTHREEGQSLLEKLGSCPVVNVEAIVESKHRTKTASVKTAAVYDKDIDKNTFRNLSAKIKTATYQFPVKPREKTPEPAPTIQKLGFDRDYLLRRQQTWHGRVNRLKEEFEKQANVLRYDVKKLDRDRKTVLKMAAIQRLGKEAETYLHGIIDNDIRVPVETASVVELNDPVIRKLAALQKTGKELINALQTFQKISRCLNIVDGTIGLKTAAANNSGGNNSGSGKNSDGKNKGFFDDWASEARKLKKQHTENPSSGGTDNSWILNPVGTTFNKTKALWDILKHPAPATDSGYAMTLPTPHQQFGLDLPSQQFKLDKVKVKSMLSDFINNDEIISSYDNDEVISAFNELSESAPEAMKRPTVARAMLREHLAKGSLGTYDLSPLLQYEKQFVEGKDNETRGDISVRNWFDSPSGRYT
jgi:hypothetical protein